MAGVEEGAPSPCDLGQITPFSEISFVHLQIGPLRDTSPLVGERSPWFHGSQRGGRPPAHCEVLGRPVTVRVSWHMSARPGYLGLHGVV